MPARLAVAAALIATVVAGQPADAGHGPADASRAELTAAWVERFLDSTGDPIVSYRATRTLEAETRGGRLRARLIALTAFDADAGFTYRILEEDGSEMIRSKVLHQALEAEQTMHAGGEGARGAITPANYAFVEAGSAGERLVQITLEPLREDRLLLRGRILLSNHDGDLVRMEGTLVKRPSFWTRRVDVVRRYERLSGVRVPIAMHSTAQVLFVGRSTFSVAYEYEEINGLVVRDLSPSSPR